MASILNIFFALGSGAMLLRMQELDRSEQAYWRSVQLPKEKGSRSNQNIILSRPFATPVPRIEHPARFSQKQLDLLFCIGLVFDAPWNHEHLPRQNMNRAIPKIDAQIAFHNDKRLV